MIVRYKGEEGERRDGGEVIPEGVSWCLGRWNGTNTVLIGTTCADPPKLAGD
jgi:hypothetical protein